MRKNHGFLKIIILIVIALAILAYYGFDIKRLIDSPAFQEKISFIWGWLKDFWTNYIWGSIVAFWNTIAVPVFTKVKSWF